MSYTLTHEIEEAEKDGEFFLVEYEVEFTYSPGSNGNRSGHPDSWTPPEGAETERISVYVEEVTGEEGTVELTQELREFWESYFESNVDEEELREKMCEKGAEQLEAEEEAAAESRFDEEREAEFL